ncbi:MAG: carbon-monoxide dehydrogenase medium subunit, partial [Verrucomicrobiales bacterium]
MQVPAPFEYERAESVDHAIGLLERLGSEARLIAGGHSLLPMMRLRLANPEYIIDINDLADELGYVRIEGDHMHIGAMTRHQQLLESDELAEAFPIFRDAERVIADPVVRNRGTIGGSLCQADPSEDLSAVCSTLDAVCVIKGSGGERLVSMHDFHQGPYETAVGDAEMLIEVRVPIRANGSSAYNKVERRAGDWAVVSSGAAVWMDGNTIADGRVGLAAVGPNTITIDAARDALTGATPSEELY